MFSDTRPETITQIGKYETHCRKFAALGPFGFGRNHYWRETRFSVLISVLLRTT